MDGNLSVSLRYSGGLSLALLKPYYLKLIYEDINNPNAAQLEQQKYNQADSIKFLNPSSILGAAPWSKGLAETELVPGAYFEIALAIIPGKSKYFTQKVTLGINGAYYAKPLPIMVDQKAMPWQVSLFAGLLIGKRKEKNSNFTMEII